MGKKSQLATFVASLQEAVFNNEPIDATDHELLALAHVAALELRSRLPVSAVRQGDLPARYESAAKARVRLYDAVVDAQETIFAKRR